MATRMASARARIPITTTVPPGTVGSGHRADLGGEEIHNTRPRAMPMGIPMAHPMTAATLAWTATATASCPLMKPSVLRMARSCRRRRTDVTSVMPSAAAAPTARAAPSSRGVVPRDP